MVAANKRSWLDSSDHIAKAIAELEEQQRIWSQIDDEKLSAVMDKKPTLIEGMEFVTNKIPSPPFLVEPFFPSGGLCLLHGKRGLGKSMLAMTLTRSIALGEPFLGQFPCRKGVVVYVQLDMTDIVFQDRLRDAGDYYKFEGWHVMTGVANFSRANENTRWVQDINACQPDLIIVDTLRKAHTWPENDSDSAGRFYSKLRELFGYTAVLMIHHDRKSMEGTQAFEGEAFRGSGAWLDDVDAGLHFKKVGKGLQIEFSKTRTCPDIDPIAVAIDDVTMTVTPDLANRSKISMVRERALSFIKFNPTAEREDVYKHLITYPDTEKAMASKVAKGLMGA